MEEGFLLPPCRPIQCGADFRSGLHKPSNSYKVKHEHARIVPPFSIQALQKNTKVRKPPHNEVFREVKIKTNPFLQQYKNGELPVAIVFCAVGKKLLWKIPMNTLDYNYYLPLFLYGLCEGEYPYIFIVERGINDLISIGAHKILACIPFIIPPLKGDTDIDRIILREHDIWYSIEDALCALERYGGPDAFLNIKYYVPNYESVVSN